MPQLVTITGIGGAGKSRLAAEVAAHLQQEIPHRAVWWVPLAGVTAAVEIPTAIAASLQITLHPDLTPFEQIVTALSHRQGLLVLDDFEQLLDEGADVVRRLLQRAPGITVLVTTWQRLGIAGEREFPLAPLPAPHSGGESPTALMNSPSALLFIDRARAARSDFDINPRNAEAIAQICEHLDGLPLALELAAAWSRLLSPVQILERLSARFDLLVSFDQDSDARHRSMHAVLEESCHLMPEDLRLFFARLSVFHGGWTLTAAEAVCGGADALEMIASLQRRSLVVAVPSGIEFRFWMLESVREFASGLLTPDESAQYHRAHCEFYATLVADAEPHLSGVQCAVWLDRLDEEVDNLRAALRWGLSHPGQGYCCAARMAASLWRYWYARGRAEEGYHYIRHVLHTLPAHVAHTIRPKLLEGAGRFALSTGAPSDACLWFKEAVDLVRDGPDRRQAAIAATNLTIAARACGDVDAVREASRLLVQLKEEDGDLWAAAAALVELGNASVTRGDGPLAYQSLSKALRLHEALGDRRGAAEVRTVLARLDPDTASVGGRRVIGIREGIGYSFLNLGHVACEQGDYDVAVPLLREALSVFQEDGDISNAAIALERLGFAALHGDAPDEARATLEEAVALRQSGVGPMGTAAFPLHLLRELVGACTLSAFKAPR
jgi:predicted ATPase